MPQLQKEMKYVVIKLELLQVEMLAGKGLDHAIHITAYLGTLYLSVATQSLFLHSSSFQKYAKLAVI